MKHLIISREYPPAPYAAGGIGTYVANISRLMAERGETVHIIGQRWDGTPKVREDAIGGRLIVHRIGDGDLPPAVAGEDANSLKQALEGLKRSDFPNQWFSWHAALLAERLIEQETVDVVEAQEWEAPLYYLLLRRALGLGPKRRPPCIVHLHSPTEVIRHFNGNISTSPDYPVMKRMETYCIHAADALLCPSHYLARQCDRLYGLDPERIRVIRLPVGSTSFLERDSQVWRDGSICFVGRIEPRKGIVEWVEAAARVAQENPAVHFDFVGSDVWRMQRTLLRRLPPALLPRFRFHGSKSRAELSHYLARAKAAVVPSRWENFPNVCIEAMSSGLPVIATRLGGMVELIEDGRTGWLAPDTGVSGMVDGLAEALRRCLATPAEQRAAMGRAAAEAVRRICDNQRTVDEQIAFRAEVARLGAKRSLELAASSRIGAGPECSGHAAASAGGGGGAGIIVRVERLAEAASVLESVLAQSKAPRMLLVVCAAALSAQDRELSRRIEEAGGEVLVHPIERGTAAWNAGMAGSCRTRVTFWMFLDCQDRLAPRCLERLEAVLRHRPDVGIVSSWMDGGIGLGQFEPRPSPDLLHQMMGNDVVPASAFRAEAVGAAPPFRSGLPRGYDTWELANRIMAQGWSAVTYPAFLAERDGGVPPIPWPDATALRAVRAELLDGFAEWLDPSMRELIDLYVPISLTTSGGDPLAERRLKRSILRLLATRMRHPRLAYRTVVRRSRSLLARLRRPLAGDRGSVL